MTGLWRGRTDLHVEGEGLGAGGVAGDEGGGGSGRPELAEMEKVVVAVVGEAELEDLLADVVGEGAGGGGRELVGGSGGGEGRVFVAAEARDGVGVVVDADEDAVVGVGGTVAGEEAEGRELAALATAHCCFSCHGGGGGGGRGWGLGVRVLGFGRMSVRRMLDV